MLRKSNKIKLGTWIGGSTESWFDFEKIQKYRKIKNPELFAKYRDKKEIFYLISVDVGKKENLPLCIAIYKEKLS